MMTLTTYSDGGARGNPGPAAIGVVLCNEQGKVVLEASHTIGHRTNNQAEYEAMLLALTLAHQQGAKKLHCFADSELLVYQLQGVYRIKDSHLKVLSEKVKSLIQKFESVTFRQVPRSHAMITRADKLLNQTLNNAKLKGPSRSVPKAGSVQEELF
jgi:ribonuclease HI